MSRRATKIVAFTATGSATGRRRLCGVELHLIGETTTASSALADPHRESRQMVRPKLNLQQRALVMECAREAAYVVLSAWTRWPPSLA